MLFLLLNLGNIPTTFLRFGEDLAQVKTMEA